MPEPVPVRAGDTPAVGAAIVLAPLLVLALVAWVRPDAPVGLRGPDDGAPLGEVLRYFGGFLPALWAMPAHGVAKLLRRDRLATGLRNTAALLVWLNVIGLGVHALWRYGRG